MHKLALVIILASISLHAQGSPVNVSSGPPPAAWTSLYDYDGSGNLIYIGSASALQPTSRITRADTTLTSIVVSSNTGTVTCASACGAWIGMRVTVSGATVDTDLNGTYTVLTTPSSTTYTITTVSVANATYNESTLVVSTNNPLTTSSVWAIECLKYDVSNKITVDSWAAGAVTPTLAWTNRTSY